MEAMRQSWTDDRLDDLNGKVDALHLEMRTEFKAVRAEMKEEFAAVRTEMKEEFAAVRTEMKEEFGAVRAETREEFKAVRTEMRGGFAEVREGFERLDDRILATHRMMFGFCGLMLSALIGLTATQI